MKNSAAKYNNNEIILFSHVINLTLEKLTLGHFLTQIICTLNVSCGTFAAPFAEIIYKGWGTFGLYVKTTYFIVPYKIPSRLRIDWLIDMVYIEYAQHPIHSRKKEKTGGKETERKWERENAE